MKTKVLVCSVYAVLILAGSAAVTNAGIEPSPWMPEFNKIHSIELNIAAIQKRLANRAAAPGLPAGTMNYLEATANHAGILDARLADVLTILPAYLSLDSADQEEVRLALDGIRSDSSGAAKFLDVIFSRMGVEPSPFRAPFEGIIARVNEYLGACTAGDACIP